MINPNLNVNKAFREQVKEFMKNTFGATTQPCIRSTFKKTGVFALLIFYETRSEKLLIEC